MSRGLGDVYKRQNLILAEILQKNKYISVNIYYKLKLAEIYLFIIFHLNLFIFSIELSLSFKSTKIGKLSTTGIASPQKATSPSSYT